MLLYINWDVDPIIFEIGSFALRWYSLFFVLGFIMGFIMVKKFFEREKLPLEWLDSLLVYMVVGTIVGARLGHCLFYDWDYFGNHILEIFLPVRFEPEFKFIGFQGLASHGGAIGIISALWLFSKRISKLPWLWVLDRIAVPTALAGCFIRLGNLMNSEIVGKETESSIGFIFRQLGEDIARHPVQLYESISYLGIFGILFYMYWKTDAPNQLGRLFGMFMALIFGARFLLEYFKRSQGGLQEAFADVLSTGQLLSIPCVLVGLYFIFRKTTHIESV